MRFLNAGGGTLFPSIRKQDAAGDPDGIVPFAQAAVAAGIGGVCVLFPVIHLESSVVSMRLRQLL